MSAGRSARHKSKGLGLTEVQGGPGGGLPASLKQILATQEGEAVPINTVSTGNGELLPSTGDIVGWWSTT